MGGRVVPWSCLPEELLAKIGECLDTRFDTIRFRSVCSKWRYSLPLSRRNWHLQLPQHEEPTPLYSFESDDDDDFELPVFTYSTTLVRSTVCIINQYPISTPWLVKLEETKQGKLRIVNPISDTPVKNFPTTFPKVLNLLDYPILEVSRGYLKRDTHLRRVSPQKGLGPTPIPIPESDDDANAFATSKLVILPDSDMITLADEFIFLTLCHFGSLFLGRNGVVREELMPIGDVQICYDDIAVYRGRFVAIDRQGIVSFFDSSSNLMQSTTPPIINGGQKKHLVVSSGHLYAVDRYYDRPQISEVPYCTQKDFDEQDAEVVSFKVYKLDEDLGWIEITRFDDQILFIGEGLNFFVPIKELSGCRGNYIYFIDEKHWYNYKKDAFMGTMCNAIAVFDMVGQSTGKVTSFPGCSEMLWPPPSWFTAN